MIPIESRIKSRAMELGFNACRITRASEATHAPSFRNWLETGQHGDMHWMTRSPERRSDPRQILPQCLSVVCLALNYFQDHQAPQRNANFRIARYAWNDDYHHLIDPKLHELDRFLKSLGGSQKSYADTGPVLERDFATNAGLGWNGKSTMQIHRQLGTWFFLSEILTTLDLIPDQPLANHCGKCSRCITSCPTRAITSPHQLDARRCISYITIESHGPIPLEFREAIGDRIYGCDTCLDVCPWNRFAIASRELAFHARNSIFEKNTRDFLNLDAAAFQNLFANSPILRLKLPRFLRNVCVAIGNTGTPDDILALTRTASNHDPFVAEHAHWAITRILQRFEIH